MASDWWINYETKKAEHMNHSRTQIALACSVLQCLGVEKVTFEYDGSGDEGFVQQIIFEPEPPGGIPEGLTEVLDDDACAFLPDGWEINEGAFGTLVLHVRSRTLHRDHNWRVLHTQQEESEINL